MSEKKMYITNPVVRQVFQSNTIQVYYFLTVKGYSGEFLFSNEWFDNNQFLDCNT